MIHKYVQRLTTTCWKQWKLQNRKQKEGFPKVIQSTSFRFWNLFNYQSKNSCWLFQRALYTDKYNSTFQIQDWLQKKGKKEAIGCFLNMIWFKLIFRSIFKWKDTTTLESYLRIQSWLTFFGYSRKQNIFPQFSLLKTKVCIKVFSSLQNMGFVEWVDWTEQTNIHSYIPCVKKASYCNSQSCQERDFSQQLSWSQQIFIFFGSHKNISWQITFFLQTAK